MTKVEWVNNYINEMRKTEERLISTGPESWEHDKKTVLNFINIVDEMTEVYNMDNKGVSNGR